VDAILGAGGSISNELVKVLSAHGRPYRLVSRHGASATGAAEIVAADLADRDQTERAVAGSQVVYMLAGLKYDHAVWAEQWPRIMTNTIEACKRTGARLVFFDNVYMYGRVNRAMTEETPFHPVSKKGEVRAQIATALIDAWKAGSLTAMIARAADFYGPAAKNGIPNAMVFDPMSKGQKPMCLVSDALPHSYTYTPDAARALVTLVETNSAWNQTWHMPTSPDPLTGREFIERAAQGMGVSAKYRVLTRPIVRVVGWFNPLVREVYEMLYQNDSPYLFDSSKYARAFDFAGTPYAEGIRATAESYRSPSATLGTKP
jgi:nucleoside-diphosphate-sugar epimerase